MTATYTLDVFSSLDAFGAATGDWTGYWGKQGPELLDHRLALYNENQRMVFGANTYRAFAQMLATSTEDADVRDPWVTRMVSLPAVVVSTTSAGTSRLAGRDARPRRRSRHRRPAQGRVRCAVAVTRQPVDEPRPHGRRSRRPRPRHALPRHHRTDGRGSDLQGSGRLRPRAPRKPNARRPHPRTHLPARAAQLAGRRRVQRKDER